MKRARNLTAVAVAAVCLLGVGAYAQEPCTARPRWIAVTLVDGYVDRWPEDGGEPERTSFGPAGRLRLLDRCTLHGNAVPWAVWELTEPNPGFEREMAAYSAGARTRITFFEDDSFRTAFVKESVQEICAAMADCGDATQP